MKDDASGSADLAQGAAATHGRALSASAGYAAAGYVIFLGFFASVAPSPLYQTYERRWHFSALTLTLIYATFALGVLVTLVLAGSVSDDAGRRPVLLAALGLLTVSTLVFYFASSTAWLFVARGIGGLATGAVISSASASLVDLQSRHDPVVVAVTNGVASNAGLGLGILTVATVVEAGSSPLMLPYLVFLGLLLIGFLGVYWMPEPVTGRRHLRWRVERPHVPAVVRRPFVLACLAVASSWSIAGLFFSLGPQLGSRLFSTSNSVVSAIGIFALLGSAAITQLALGRSTAPWLGASGGSLALAVGILLIVLAAATESGAVYFLGSVISGFGFGLSFLGGLRALVGAIPAQHRAGVLAAFYIVAYASLSVPAVVAGLVVGDLGLLRTFEWFGVIAAALALVVAVEAWRTRPASRATPA